MHITQNIMIMKKQTRITLHVTFFPSVNFFSGCFRIISAKWILLHNPLMWSDNLTIIPKSSRVIIVPWDEEHSWHYSSLNEGMYLTIKRDE